jgi:PII-like signaling protein
VNEDSLKLTSYFGERQRTADNGFAADALLDLYGRRGVATSILLRGAEGFGVRQHLRTDRSESLSHDLPLTAVAVDTRSRIEGLLEPTVDLLRSGLVTLERARLLTGDLETVVPGQAPDEEAKLTVYVGRQERVYRVPAFVAVCDLLHRRGIAGATALLGVDGTAHGERERAAFFSRNAATPMMIIAVGSGTKIARVLPELGGLLRQPLLTLERVTICKRDGTLLCRPPAVADSRPATDGTGQPVAHKLMVYTSEAALHDGQPIHRAIVRRLRAAGISGATTQRGMWGFHGDHLPHGDRLLQLGRRVPAVTIVIDTPERIRAAFDLIEDLTAEQGLVTCETIPVTRQKPVGARSALALISSPATSSRADGAHINRPAKPDWAAMGAGEAGQPGRRNWARRSTRRGYR